MKPFLNPQLTVDVVLFTIEDGKLKVLTITRENEPYKGLRALPGGYLFQDETTRDAALRVLAEKTGVSNVYIEQLYTFDEPGRDPRGPVFSVTYMALVPSPLPHTAHPKHLQQPELIDVAKLPKMAFDHKKIVDYALSRIRGKLEYTTIGFNALPKLFTLSQVQQVYEIILDKTLDKRNFRKKLEQLKLVKETKHMQSGLRQRPAKLYTLASTSKTIKNF